MKTIRCVAGVFLTAMAMEGVAVPTPGTLVGWGQSNVGQTNVPAGLTNIIVADGGISHVLAVRVDGSLTTWGTNSYGLMNVPAGLSNLIAVSAGYNHSLVLRPNGTVVAWGDNARGQTNVPASATNVVTIRAGSEFSLAVRSNGTIVVWGDNSYGQANVPAGLTNPIAISAGGYHTLAVQMGGQVFGWGYNYYGQSSVPSSLTNAIAVAAGADHSAAVTAEGKVIAWGSNAFGQTNVPPGLSNVIAISAGGYHTMALRSDGTVVVWGENVHGQTNVPPGLSGVLTAECGFKNTFVIREPVAPVVYTTAIGVLPSSLTFTGQVASAMNSQSLVVSNVGPGLLIYSIGSDAFWLSVSNMSGSLLAGETATHAVNINTFGLKARTYSGSLTVSAYGATSQVATMTLTLGGGIPQAGVLSLWGDNSHGQLNKPADLGTIMAVAGGGEHVLALKPDGTVRAWGNNSYGQINVPVGLSNVVDVAAGSEFSLALKGNGTVVAWGDGRYGQLNIPAGLSNVVSIAASEGYHALALRADGMIAAWGYNAYGQSTVPAGLGDVVTVVVGAEHSMVLKSNGRVVAWGRNQYGQTNVPSGLTNVVGIAGGYAHSAALKSDGTVIAWGWNVSGQTNVPSDLTNVAAIESGNGHLVARKSGGTVHAWGYNGHGQVTVPEGVTNAFFTTAAAYFSMALTPEVDEAPTTYSTEIGLTPSSLAFTGQVGSVLGSQMLVVSNVGPGVLNYSVGSDSFWLGVSNASGSLLAGETATHAVAVKTFGLKARSYSGKLTVSAPGATSQVEAVSLVLGGGVQLSGMLAIWGDNSHGELNQPADLGVVVATAGGGGHVLALKPDGTVRAWGNNSYGQLNVPAGLSNVVDVAAGSEFSLVLKGNGTVVAWGDNRYGQLGIPAGLSNVVSIAAVEGYHALALKADGTIVAWGYNAYGQVTVPAGLNDVVAVAVGAEHSMVLKSNGRVQAWGRNQYGQTNVPSELSNVVAIAGGYAHAVALRLDGTVATWGWNAFGQTTVPAGATNAVAVSAGNEHTMALRADGAVLTWGHNGYGQSTVPAGVSNPISISAATYYSLAILSQSTSTVPAMFTLDVTTTGGGTVDVPGGAYSNGLSLSLTASADSGYTFGHWVGDISSGIVETNPLVITMDQDRSVTAVFVKNNLNTNGMLLHYTFDEGSGSVALDQSGNSHTGQVVDASWTGLGYMGGAIDFSGEESARVEVNLNRTLLGRRALTVAAWIKSKGDPGNWENVMGSAQTRPDLQSPGIPVLFLWLDRRSIGNDAKSQLWLQEDDGSLTNVVLQMSRTVDEFHNGIWQHVALTWDGTNLNHYVTGLLDGSATTPAGHLMTNSTIYVGNKKEANHYENFNGYIDDLRIYDHALSGAEVEALCRGNVNQVSLTIDGTPEIHGTPQPFDYGTYQISTGTVVTNGVEPVVTNGNVRFVSTGWNGEGSVPSTGFTNVVSFTADTNSTLVWQWTEEEYLDLETSGDGTIDGADGWVPYGSNVTLTAIPAVGSHFTRWGGADIDPDFAGANPYVYSVEAPSSVTAHFEQATFAIAGSIFAAGSSTVRVEACSGSAFTVIVASCTLQGAGAYALTNLPAGRDYWIWAYADLNGDGDRDDAEAAGTCSLNPVHLMADVAGADISLAHVSPPTGLEARAGIQSVDLIWSPNVEAGIVGYHVYRDTTNGLDRLTTTPVESPAFTDRNIDSDSTPTYRVTAVLSVDGGTWIESLSSDPVTVMVGELVLWMPDYAGPPGSDVRLRISAENIDGVLGSDMEIVLSYDPSRVVPLTQANESLPTVEKTVVTEQMDVHDNGATASGLLYLSSTNSLTSGHATLWLLGCDLVSRSQRPVPVVCGVTNSSAGMGWQWLAGGADVNDGEAHSVDLGAVGSITNCTISVSTADRTVRTDVDAPFVTVLRNGDTVSDVSQWSDLPSHVQPYVDDDLRVNIGTNDALFFVEMEGSTHGAAADFFDAILLVEYNAGATLAGEGHLFDILFRVASNAVNGMVMTNAITAAYMVDRHGDALSIDTTDTALFTVQGSYILGDINGDGDVDVSGDFTLAMKIAVGQLEPNAYQLMAGDIDGDGVITTTDAVLIKRIIDGLDTNPGNAAPGGGGWIVDMSEPENSDSFSVVVDTAFAAPGDEGPVNITVYGADAMAGMDLVLTYDPAILMLTGVTNAGIGADMALATNGSSSSIELVLAGSGSLGSASGVVATLQFRVNEAAAYGALSPLTIAACGTIDEYGRELSADLVDGSVTVSYSDTVDSDGDGLSDFAEQFQDGSRGYSYWSLLNLYGRDSNLLDPDTDDDGMNDGDEVTSGTSLTDSGDVLALFAVAPQTSNGVSVVWQSVSGHLYRVECSTHLLDGFVPVATGLVGQAGTTVYTDIGAGSGPRRLYRVVHE